VDWFVIEGLILALLPDTASLWLFGYIFAIGLLAWLEHRSPAFADAPVRATRWPTNLGIGVINIGLATLVPVSAVLAAEWAQRNGFGLLNTVAAPWLVAAVATVLARSLAGYAFHVLMHKVPMLWRLHRVHHSDTHLDVSTALRSHPLEFVTLLFVMVPVTVAFGLNPVVLAAYEIVEATINLAGHTNVRLPERLDRALRILLVTPNMHCVHHSSWHHETDSNYGNVFSIWDRLFRTYRDGPRGGYDGMQIGLKEIRDERASNLLWQLKSPALDYRKPPEDTKTQVSVASK